MSKKYAEFVKCALQVNPYNYIKYRGEVQTFGENEYNQEILRICKEQQIRVVGLADHGSAHSGESLRTLLSENGITVFPGFEIASSEKIHIVCLFPEDTPPRTLDRYLGQLGLINVEDGISPSDMTCKEIGRIVNTELDGFWYAAHITNDNGILKLGQMQQTWKSEHLIAAQIPSTRSNLEFNHKNIIENKDPNYFRSQPMALINARDVSKPDDLEKLESSSLIKLSEINFSGFKQAFNDPDSRVKLLTELDDNHHSVISKVQISGGYLDEFNIKLSRNLNTVIGGRGTGKSTLVELLRYALGKEAISPQSKMNSKNLVESNLGSASGKIELTISSNQQHGRGYKIIKRYGEPTVITDIDGILSNLKIEDILPSVEIIGQNEIMELSQNEEAKIQILNRFLPNMDSLYTDKKQILRELKINRETIVALNDKLEDLSSQVQLLPNLNEKMKAFEELGIKDKLSVADNISREEEYFRLIDAELKSKTFKLPLLELPFQTEDVVSLPNKKVFIEVETIFADSNKKINELIKSYNELISDSEMKKNKFKEEWEEEKEAIHSEIQKAIKSLPGIHGKTGEEIAEEFKHTSLRIAQINPLSAQRDKIDSEFQSLLTTRDNHLERLRVCNDKIRDSLRTSIKRVNKGPLKGKIRIELLPNKNRINLSRFIEKLPTFGPKTLEWINLAEALTIPTFCYNLDNGILYEKYKTYGLTSSRADIIATITLDQRLQLDEIELQDTIDIQLNVSAEGDVYKSLDKLSKGQQCTAILNILLLENKDPLIIDQPEDNLDNAFIANNIVSELREHKMKRQFIFASHNANIPVFGDSELIIVMQEEDGQGVAKDEFIGSIDAENVKQSVIRTLEGGDNAFRMRKLKYNL